MATVRVKFVPDLLKFSQIISSLKAVLARSSYLGFITDIIGSAPPGDQHPLDFFKDIGLLTPSFLDSNLQQYLAQTYGQNPAVQKLFFYYYTPNVWMCIEDVQASKWDQFRCGWGQHFDTEMLKRLSHSQFLMRAKEMPPASTPRSLSDVIDFIKMVTPRQVTLNDFIKTLETAGWHAIVVRVMRDLCYFPETIFKEGTGFAPAMIKATFRIQDDPVDISPVIRMQTLLDDPPPFVVTPSQQPQYMATLLPSSSSSSSASPAPRSFKAGKKIEGDSKMQDIPPRLFNEVWNDRFTPTQIKAMQKAIPSKEIELIIDPVNFLEIWHGMKSKEQVSSPETHEKTVSEWLHYLEGLHIPNVSFAPLWENINNPQASASTRGFKVKDLKDTHISFIIGRGVGFFIDDWENLLRGYQLRYPKDSIEDPYDLFDLLMEQQPELSLELMLQRAQIGSPLHQFLDELCNGSRLF